MEYRKEIINLYNSDEYQRLKAYYSKRSLLDILGVARSEIAHSNMLAWLLDPNETHGLGLFPMRKFLHLLVVAKLELAENIPKGNEKRAVFDTTLMDSILTNSCILEKVSVEAEKSVDSTGDKHKDSRIDIYAEVMLRLSKDDNTSKILPIVVENKVGSKEHDDQTSSYYKWCMKEVECHKERYFTPPLFVYLTAHHTLALNGDRHCGEISCSCSNYIHINYQYIADYLIEQCLKQSISDDTRKVLNDYLRSLTYIYINGDIKEGDTFEELAGKFNVPQIKRVFGGVVVREDTRHIDPKGRKRYFDNEDDAIPLDDGTRVCVCSNWDSGNIEAFIKRAKELGFAIMPVLGR